jgi:hypothetical protein
MKNMIININMKKYDEGERISAIRISKVKKSISWVSLNKIYNRLGKNGGKPVEQRLS